MGKVRGQWGGINGTDSHGNNIKLLSVIGVMNKLNKHQPPNHTALKSAQKHFPELVQEGVTYEGEKFLAKLHKIGLAEAITLLQ